MKSFLEEYGIVVFSVVILAVLIGFGVFGSGAMDTSVKAHQASFNSGTSDVVKSALDNLKTVP